MTDPTPAPREPVRLAEVDEMIRLHRRSRDLDEPVEISHEAWRVLGDLMRHNAGPLLDTYKLAAELAHPKAGTPYVSREVRRQLRAALRQPTYTEPGGSE